MEISERQKIKREIYAELDKYPRDYIKLGVLNGLLAKNPPQIEEPHRYNFQRKIYERKSINTG